jgi:hypothetical protein
VGWVLIEGGVAAGAFTVSVTMLLVALPTELVILTYTFSPLSDVVVWATAKELEFEPDALPLKYH